MVTEVVLADGTTISFQTMGAGPLVVVCSGGPSTTFEYLLDDLQPLASDFTLAFHHYRGSGRSSSALSASYTFEQLAHDAHALAAALGFDTFDVLAHSMGGMVALSTAIEHPMSVRRMVLIDCSPSGVPSRMAMPTIKALGVRRLGKVCGRAAKYVLWWRWRPESAERTRARFAIMETMQEGAPEHREEVRRREVLADNDNAPHLERHASTFDVVDRLASIQTPTLVVYGTLDAPFVAGSRLLLDHLPNAVEVRLAGTGHHPLVEDHDHVIAEIRRFLKSA
ncbi:MAG TPA: alpha/beta hydrolase [Ilumatobacteraceae bacterium]|nr:alpha/beta hydrolase [Ilumatobacteraceae bacterium]